MYSIKHFFRVYTTWSGKLENLTVQNTIYIYCKHQRRHLFGIQNRKKEYYGRKLVGYSRDQMFSVVADVKNYKNFVPFCKKSLIIREHPGFLKADLEIGFPPIVESYTSNVTLIKPQLVKAVCMDGKLFNLLTTTWRFSPGLKSNPLSCIIDFEVTFEFKSLVHSNLAHMFFEKLVKQMEGAFILEAKRRYGKESLPSHSLIVVKHSDSS